MPRTEQSYLDEVNTIIPALLKHFHIDRSVVYGHSEGAAIAILYASTSQNVDALILESPFLVAHAAAAELVSRMQTGYPGSELQQRLSKYHLNADAVFQCWASAAGNLADGQVAFAKHLAKVPCPVLVLQGSNDAFGTSAHLKVILAALPLSKIKEITGAGHLPHREKTAEVIALVTDFPDQVI